MVYQASEFDNGAARNVRNVLFVGRVVDPVSIAGLCHRFTIAGAPGIVRSVFQFIARGALSALVLLCLLLAMPLRAGADRITVWVYHDFPPFVVDADTQTGMSFNLARMLTERAQGRYAFDVVVLPRQRLNAELENDAPGVVLWVNPLWFGDAGRDTYLWTAAVLNDRNDVISPMEEPFTYDGPTSLDGKTLVGVKGHRYPGIDLRIAAGTVDRMDVSSEAALVQFIASGRGSVGVIAHSAAWYFVQSYGLEDHVHFAPAAHSTYQRFIMVQPQLPDVHAFVQENLPAITASQDWQAMLDQHGFDAVPTQ